MRHCHHEKAHFRMSFPESTSFIAFGIRTTRTFKRERYFDLLAASRGILAAVRSKRLFSPQDVVRRVVGGGVGRGDR